MTEYKSTTQTPTNQVVKPKYDVKQVARRRNFGLQDLMGEKGYGAFTGLAALGGLVGDTLFNSRDQQKPLEYRNQEQINANVGSERALSSGIDAGKGMQAIAGSLANKVGNKALNAISAQSANSGYEGANTAAAVAGNVGDKQLSDVGLNAYTQGVQVENQVRQNYVGNMQNSSNLTQNLTPGLDKDIAILDAIAASPEAMNQAKKRSNESIYDNMYDRYAKAEEPVNPEQQRLEAEANKAVPAQPTTMGMQSVQGTGEIKNIAETNPLFSLGNNMLGALTKSSIIDTKKKQSQGSLKKPETKWPMGG